MLNFRKTSMLLTAAFVLAAAPCPVFAAYKDVICDEPLLTYNEKSLCKEQVMSAQTRTELKKVQEKYRDRIAQRKDQRR